MARLRFKPAAVNSVQAAGQQLRGKFQMLLALDVDAEQVVIFSHGAKGRKWKEQSSACAGFWVAKKLIKH